VSGRLVVLSTTHRVAAGLLTWPAWRVLHDADTVVIRQKDHPLAPHLQAAGVQTYALQARSDRELASALARRAENATVVFVAGSDGDAGVVEALVDVLPPLAERGQAPEVEVLPGSYDVPGARMLDLVAVMDRLRSPGGCPWDAEQSHESLLRYLLEEAYETVEAVETDNRAWLREELGDVLLQVVFHSRIAQDHPDEPFTVDDVAAGIVDKLVSRHPHVFGSAAVEGQSAAELEASWDALKAAEKGRTSAVDGVPLAQPGLALADKLLGRAERAGVQAPPPDAGVELPASADAVGDLLLGMVAQARARGIEAESALRGAARRYADQVRAVEAGGRPPPTT
jgi:XTP/dITP diphosphohydrolase